MADILVVDDDENVCSALRMLLETDRHSPRIVSNVADALKAIRDHPPDLVFLDLRMPGINGLEGLKQIRSMAPGVYAIVMTAYSSSQTSIEAMQLGAFDYLNKPVGVDEIREVIDRALAAQGLNRKASEAQPDEWERYSLVNLVGSSTRMREAYKVIGILSTNNIPALAVGERGTGKQLVGKTIHFNSARKEGPFVRVDCETAQAAIDVEIFGQASAGDGTAVPGGIERANGGTLFINHVEHLPAAVQFRLLRFLKEKTYERTGSTQAQTADVRIVAGAAPEFAERLPDGFNKALYQALTLITIKLPPLRERPEDVAELVKHFMRQHNLELNKNIMGVDSRALELLREQDWPGNVAELENVLKRACILARGDALTFDDIRDALDRNANPAPAEVRTRLEAAAREALQQELIGVGSPSSVFYKIIGAIETTLVSEALRITGGNQVKAAELLGLNRTTLRRKLQGETSST